ncbi:Ig-like domain-containing protein [Microbacterium sp. ZW T5_45]|uniref:Ig-like domain-containing protein n=1 Tax=Microbacterium sp. ZW T5_45 TaxID=3378080 RepID=UPI0038526BEF
MSNRSRAASSLREKTGLAFRRSAALTVGATTLLAGVLLPVTAASAAEDVITVTNLNLSGAGSFRAALETANASTNADGVRVVFDAALAGTGELSLTGGAVNSMQTTDFTGPASQNSTLGARFLIDSTVPVSVDFTNLDGITDIDGSFAAGIYVKSDNVSLSNLANLRAAESGIAIGGENVTVTNVELKDTESWTQEVGVLLLEGATDTTLTDVSVFSPYWGSIVVDNGATVADTTITGLESRGVENWGHVIFEDGSTITNFSVADSIIGNPAETSPTQGFYFNPDVTITGLSVTDSTIQSPNQNGVFFLGGGQTLTNTTFTGNTFGGNADAYISRTIGGNTADWTGLTFSDNTVSYAGSVVFNGTLTDAVFAGNTFSNVRDGAWAALQLGDVTKNVDVTGNTFDNVWALDGIRVQGSSADDVVIADNTLENVYADVSRSAIRIDAAGAGNFVRNNTLTQDLTDDTLPANVTNHWAIYNSASAANAESEIGWSILNNAIDGFGTFPLSEAPIVNNATGKLLVTGNTLGVNTKGSADVETEEGGYWLFWNVWNSASNNTVQTFRAEEVRYDGANATFTAAQPAPLIGNNAAVGPVTLHVYWTAADNAEEYLGEITGVTAGQRVSIPTSHTDGFVRVQTVDAGGYTSQYSSIDEDTAFVPAAPVVTEVDENAVIGTGVVGGVVTVRDEDDNVIGTSEVGEDGTWTVTGLECGTTYTVTQTLGEVDSEPVEFTTAACATDADADADGGTAGSNASASANGTSSASATSAANGSANGSGTGSLATTGGENLTGLAVGSIAVLLLGAAFAFFTRRRRA